jgi:hypothetical protein
MPYVRPCTSYMTDLHQAENGLAKIGCHCIATPADGLENICHNNPVTLGATMNYFGRSASHAENALAHRSITLQQVSIIIINKQTKIFFSPFF